jgi:hypothetical protein
MSGQQITPCFSLPVRKPVAEMTGDERSAFAEKIVAVILGAGPVDDRVIYPPPVGSHGRDPREPYQRHVRHLPAPRT